MDWKEDKWPVNVHCGEDVAVRVYECAREGKPGA